MQSNRTLTELDLTGNRLESEAAGVVSNSSLVPRSSFLVSRYSFPARPRCQKRRLTDSQKRS
jgi:hypothetical protein